jgi:hypothetical protein
VCLDAAAGDALSRGPVSRVLTHVAVVGPSDVSVPEGTRAIPRLIPGGRESP